MQNALFIVSELSSKNNSVRAKTRVGDAYAKFLNEIVDLPFF